MDSFALLTSLEGWTLEQGSNKVLAWKADEFNEKKYFPNPDHLYLTKDGHLAIAYLESFDYILPWCETCCDIAELLQDDFLSQKAAEIKSTLTESWSKSRTLNLVIEFVNMYRLHYPDATF